MTSAANGYALVIGVGAVKKDNYQDWDGKDPTCVNDATAIAEFARDRHFLLLDSNGTPDKDNPPLLTENADHATVKKIMTAASKLLNPGDLFLVYFSGHGGTYPKDDDSGLIGEFWSLYDQPLYDDEWDGMLAVFQEGVRVVVISDSCWSAGFGPPDEKDPPGLANIVFTPASDRLCGFATGGGKVRAVPKKTRDAIKRAGKSSDPSEIPATVLLLAACQANQQAYSDTTNGVFTGALLEVATNNRGLSYKGLYRLVRRTMTCPLQSPHYWQHGAGAYAFGNDKAFSIQPVPAAYPAPAKAAPVKVH